MTLCRKCKIEKEESEFSPKEITYDYPRCKKCNSEKCKKYFKENKEDLLSKRKSEIDLDRESYNKNARARRNKNPDLANERTKRWRQENPDKIRKYKNFKYHNDVNTKLSEILRRRISCAVKNNQKAGSAVRDLGCSIDEFKIYLENKFQEGMTWENWSYSGWHIDHIKPLASFDLSNREQFLEACNYKNLQPLWAIDNLKKSNKTI